MVKFSVVKPEGIRTGRYFPMKTLGNSEECEKVIPELGYKAYGGIVCMRLAGHSGRCIATIRDARVADGLCWSCKASDGEPHLQNCRIDQIKL